MLTILPTAQKLTVWRTAWAGNVLRRGHQSGAKWHVAPNFERGHRAHYQYGPCSLRNPTLPRCEDFDLGDNQAPG